MGKVSLQIGFGALQPTIEKQLKAQGFKFDKEEVKHYEKLRESITYLMFASVLNDKETDRAKERLFKIILNHVEKKNAV